MNGKCDKSNCTNDARYHPVLLLYAPRKYNLNQPIKSILSLEICQDCMEKAILDDFISNEGWIQICEMIDKAGKILPDRSRSQLAFDRIGSFKQKFETL